MLRAVPGCQTLVNSETSYDPEVGACVCLRGRNSWGWGVGELSATCLTWWEWEPLCAPHRCFSRCTLMGRVRGLYTIGLWSLHTGEQRNLSDQLSPLHSPPQLKCRPRLYKCLPPLFISFFFFFGVGSVLAMNLNSRP